MGDGHTQSDNEHSQNKCEILDDFENNVPSSRKRQRRVTRNENINKLCLGLVSGFCLLNIFIYLFVCFITHLLAHSPATFPTITQIYYFHFVV
jgi:hypothetical protein